MTTALAPTSSNAVSQTVDLPVDIAWPDLQAAISGDLNKLSAEGRVKYFNALCKFTGLNPLGFPFEWITFQGKLRLYPKKECADQLRGVHKITAKIIERVFMDDICMVRVLSKMPDGREFESTGAVPYTKGMAPLDRCKAIKVAETQAYRRGTFGLVGLGNLPDEDSDVPAATVSIAEVAMDSTSSRADKLNAVIAEKEAIDVGSSELVNWARAATETIDGGSGGLRPSEDTPNTNASPSQPSPPEPNNQAAAEPSPAPTQSEFDSPSTQPFDVQKMASELDLVFSEFPNPPDCLGYIIAKKQLQKGQDLSAIDPTFAKKIFGNPKGFLRAVEQWVKGGRK